MTHTEITQAFAHWDDIDVHYRGEVLTSTGHGFCGLAAQKLLSILQRGRAARRDVRLLHRGRSIPPCGAGADLVVAADGVNSWVRATLRRALRAADRLAPATGSCGSARRFRFPPSRSSSRRATHGLWRVHAYRYERALVDVHRRVHGGDLAARRARRASEDETVAFTEELFARELGGHPLLKNRSLWRAFPTVRNARWHHDNVVLVGDAAHTAHFSIGSGTKLAMEDAIALARALRRAPRSADGAGRLRGRAPAAGREAAARGADQPRVVRGHRALPRPARAGPVRLQPADAQPAHHPREPQGARRHVRGHGRPLVRRARLAAERRPRRRRRHRRRRCSRRSGCASCVLPNRVVVSPMCQYSAEDGTPGDWHLVHLGSRARRRRRPGDGRDDRRQPRGPHHARLRRHVQARARGRVEAHRRLRAPREPGPDRHPARRTPAARARRAGCGRGRRAAGDGQLAARLRLAAPVLPAQPGAARDDRADMDGVRDDFVRAAQLAEQAGFDLLELHMAHGYLLASFISPLTNRRDRRVRRLARATACASRWRSSTRSARRGPPHKPMSVRLSAHRLEGRRARARRRRRGGARAAGPRLRHRRRVGRADRARSARRRTAACSRRRSPTASATRPASRR